ncbi:helicase-associated domain-containing protein, partial [Paenibacillus glucanolyticus]
MMDQQNSAGRCSLDQLHPKERSVLQHIWRRFAGQSFDDDRLRSMHVQRLSGMEVQLAFVSLRQQGWVQ